MIETQPYSNATELGNNGHPRPQTSEAAPENPWGQAFDHEAKANEAMEREFEACAHIVRCESLHPVLFDREQWNAAGEWGDEKRDDFWKNAFVNFPRDVLDIIQFKHCDGEKIKSPEQLAALIEHGNKMGRLTRELRPDAPIEAMCQHIWDTVGAADEADSRQIVHDYFTGQHVIGRLVQLYADQANSDRIMASLAGKIANYRRVAQEVLTGAGGGGARIEIKSFGDAWNAHEEKLNQTRGRELIGLKTGVDELDRRLFGLQGFTLLGAMPGVGKTALALQIGRGVCREHAVNDAVVVILSLEMSEDTLMSRLKASIANLDWKVYVNGSYNQQPGQPIYNARDAQKITEGWQRMIDEQINHRLFIFGKPEIDEKITASTVIQLVKQVKQRVGARRALVVLDYLQMLEPATERGSDLDVDKARVRLCQDVLRGLKDDENNPLGDALLAISEARKPPGDQASRNTWGQDLASIMGSARIGYGVDNALMYRPMTDKECCDHYGIDDNRLDAFKIDWERDGIAPVMLTVEKGRDGTARGDIALEFDYRGLQFHPVRSRAVENATENRNGQAIGNGRLARE